MRVGVISDTHGTFDERLENFLSECEIIIHAGDIGSLELADQISAFRPMSAVYGNIDDHRVRRVYKEFETIEIEGVKILVTHIGGYPGRYDARALAKIKEYKPNIFIAGHSHILKVIYDKKHDLLHINPGAAGVSGFHTIRTAIRFTIQDGKPSQLEVGEWQRSGR